MGRETMFRGKRLDNGKWVAGHYLTRRMQDGLHHTISVQDMWGFHDVHPDSVGQYTGLKDKNGVEIYEGAIVKHEEEDGKVEYHSEEAMFVVVFDTWLTDFDHINGRDLEVVGNIYDNADLIAEV